MLTAALPGHLLERNHQLQQIRDLEVLQQKAHDEEERIRPILYDLLRK